MLLSRWFPNVSPIVVDRRGDRQRPRHIAVIWNGEGSEGTCQGNTHYFIYHISTGIFLNSENFGPLPIQVSIQY